MAGLLVAAGSDDDEQPDKANAILAAAVVALTRAFLIGVSSRLSIDRVQTIER